MNDFIRTYTSGVFHTDPRPEEVSIDDIAMSLSRIPRWGGHTKLPYSVAAHSMYVAKLLPSHLQLTGLLHDASEAYLADIPSPFKVLLPDYKKLEERIMSVIFRKLNPKGRLPDLEPLVKKADGVALFSERVMLFDSAANGDVPVMLSTHDSGLDGNFSWNWNKYTALPAFLIAEEFIELFTKYASK